MKVLDSISSSFPPLDQSQTVQGRIDEKPQWSDGTIVVDIPLTSMQWRIWFLATAGKFFEGMVVFMTGVALPLISVEFKLSPIEKGFVGSALLFGILVGATALGGLADRYGRKQMFIAEMILFTLFLIAVTLSPNFIVLLVCLVGMGAALGCDYPTAHMVISESIPSYLRGRLVLSAFGFQAVGALTGTAVGLLILDAEKHLYDWRLMFATVIVPAILVCIGRFFIPQSAHWLMGKGRVDQAEKAVKDLLRREPAYPVDVKLRELNEVSGTEQPGFRELFSKKKRRRATILASVPWFLQDLGTYGIGIFTPIILTSTLGVKSTAARNLAEIFTNTTNSARGAALIDTLLIVGIIAAVCLVDRVGRIRLQIIGFIGCALGLFLAAMSAFADGSTKMMLIFAGFMVFNFMTNMGPNAMTYLIAGEVFSTRVRGLGAGFAASFAKIGAVITAFLFPILLKDIHTTALLLILVGTSLLGAFVTWKFQIETTGVNLENMDEEEHKSASGTTF